MADPHVIQLRDKIYARFLAAKAVTAVDSRWQGRIATGPPKSVTA